MHYQRKTNLILLPGLDGTGMLFQPLVEQLSDIFHVTVLPYPTDRPSSFSEMVAMVKEQLIHPEDTILLAESFSGLVAYPFESICYSSTWCYFLRSICGISTTIFGQIYHNDASDFVAYSFDSRDFLPLLLSGVVCSFSSGYGAKRCFN